MIAYFNKKTNKKKFISAILLPAAGVILCVASVVLIFVNLHIYKQKKELISKVEYYQNKIGSIKRSNQELKDGIENIDNIDYLEKIAYEQLGQQKPGEKAVIFIAPEQSQKEADNSGDYRTGQLLSPLNSAGRLFQGIWSWIKSRF